jgi:hypothetical protein
LGHADAAAERASFQSEVPGHVRAALLRDLLTAKKRVHRLAIRQWIALIPQQHSGVQLHQARMFLQGAAHYSRRAVVGNTDSMVKSYSRAPRLDWRLSDAEYRELRARAEPMAEQLRREVLEREAEQGIRRVRERRERERERERERANAPSSGV